MTAIFGLSLPVATFTSQFEPGAHYGDDWAQVQELLLESPADRMAVSLFRDQLRETGCCSPPVWVQLRLGQRSLRVGSGEHQVVAALLESADVTYYISPEEVSSATLMRLERPDSR